MNNSYIKVIPADKLAKLNAKAQKNGRYHVGPEAPIMSGDNHAPVFRSWPGVFGTEWVRCEIPSCPDCLSTVLIDLSISDFAKLPKVPSWAVAGAVAKLEELRELQEADDAAN